VRKREEAFEELDREMEKRHDLVKVQKEVDNAEAEAQAGRRRNEVQVVTMSPSGIDVMLVLRRVYRSLAGFRTMFFWVVSAPLSTLVHFDNPTCDRCSQKRPIIASRVIGR
jgi:hypothetical protein